MWPFVEALIAACAAGVRWMRDPTRGGVATALNELARDARVFTPSVRSAIEDQQGFFCRDTGLMYGAGTVWVDVVPAASGKLQTLTDVGLSYVRLGQNATTLSGGEAQRVKLARELAKRATGRTLYILDEPTTGLHFHDVEQLLQVLHRLRDDGNTIVVIEHNLDVIKTADWIIDLGPEGGEGGGEIIATGTPEDVAANGRSWTGRYLQPLLERERAPAPRAAAQTGT